MISAMKFARMQVVTNTLYHQMQAQAENVAGGNFDQLQREAYKNLGINVAPPPTKLDMVRRTSLFRDKAKVFDLNVGAVSAVLESGARKLF